MEVASRELRNNTRAVLDRAARGEDVVITVRGRPTARLQAVADRPRWVARATFVEKLEGAQADPGLADELDELAPDDTEDLPWP